MKPAFNLTCLLLVALSLVSCNRPAQEPPANVLATQVSGTLTAAPTLPPSITPPPSQTPIATSTVTPTETPINTSTPTPGASPSPTSLPLPPDDPRTGLNLSVPDYRDDFSIAYKWIGPNDADATNIVDNKKLTASDLKADHYIWWSTTDQSGEDVYTEVTAAIGACSGKDSAGLAVRINGTGFDQGYALEVACDGTFRLREFVTKASPKVILDWTAGPDIKKGPNASNRIGLLAKGSKLYVFANGKLEGQAENSDYTSGTYGLYASAEATAPLEVTFTDFALWYPK